MRFRRSRARSERGAVAVEAALVTPVIMLMVFGIIEFSLLLRDDVALTSSVRAGGRTASALAGAGPAGTDAEGDCTAPCSGANVPKLAQMAANAIQRDGSALPKDSIQELWIYKANSSGFPGTATSESTMTCTTDCVRYRWVASKDQFRYLTGTWISSTIKACANASPDSVGVYMVATHPAVSGLFFKSVNISDRSVFAFEPLPSLSCAAGTHP